MERQNCMDFLLFKTMLEKRGYSENEIKKLWKWYDSSERKGVASY